MQNSLVTRTIFLTDSALHQKELLDRSIEKFILSDFLNATAVIKGKEIIFTCSSANCARVEEIILSITSKFDLNPQAVWAYLDKQGFYSPFPKSINDDLEKFYIENAKTIDPNYFPFSSSLQISGHELSSRIEFDKLGGFHVMIKNNEIFPVKRFSNFEKFKCDDFEGCWQWKNEKNEYCYYEEDISYFIELCYRRCKNDKSLKYFYIPSSSGVCYRLNVDKMEQKNLRSNFTRSIRRKT